MQIYFEVDSGVVQESHPITPNNNIMIFVLKKTFELILIPKEIHMATSTLMFRL